MTVALDTNVLIDAIVEQREYQDAQALILAIAQGRLAGLISANSITDIYYILKKRIGDERTREAIRNLLSVFQVAEVGLLVCETALNLPMKDFEDAVLAVCAKIAGADAVVTGDLAFLAETEAPVQITTVRDILDTLS